jgi:hypothetical protein
MTLVEQKAFKNALQILDALKCSYAIIDVTGTKYGGLEVVDKAKRKRQPHKYTYGLMAKHLHTYLDKLEVGDVVSIPAENFALKDVLASASSMGVKKWGVKSVTSLSNQPTNCVEVLRIK